MIWKARSRCEISRFDSGHTPPQFWPAKSDPVSVADGRESAGVVQVQTRRATAGHITGSPYRGGPAVHVGTGMTPPAVLDRRPRRLLLSSSAGRGRGPRADCRSAASSFGLGVLPSRHPVRGGDSIVLHGEDVKTGPSTTLSSASTRSRLPPRSYLRVALSRVHPVVVLTSGRRIPELCVAYGDLDESPLLFLGVGDPDEGDDESVEAVLALAQVA